MKPKPKSKMGSVDLMVHDVPVSLKKQFKAACAQRGVPMRRIIMDKMEEFVRQVA